MSAVDDLLETMRTQQRSTIDRVKDVTEEQMLGPTTYGRRETNARYIFYRLIAHEVEHTVHLAKTLNGLGIVQNEAAMILKQLQAARGELEGMLIGLSDEDLDRAPAEGEWSVREVIQHILDADESYTKRIEEGVQATSG